MPVVEGWAAGEAVLLIQRLALIHVVHDVEVTHLVVVGWPEHIFKVFQLLSYLKLGIFK